MTRDTDPLWRRVERAMVNKIKRRDEDYIELHREYIVQQKLLSEYKAYCRSIWAANDLARANAEWRV